MNKSTLWNKCQKAASLLDKEKPGWHKEIDIDRLRMGLCTKCVLGQLYGHYRNALSKAIIDKASDMGIVKAFGEYLFDDKDKSSVNKYWIKLIEMRMK